MEDYTWISLEDCGIDCLDVAEQKLSECLTLLHPKAAPWKRDPVTIW